MAELFIEDTTYTLNGAVSSTGATSITVAAVTGSLGAAPTSMTTNTFRARIDAELLVVTATDSTGLIWTVTRGAEGTTAATHASGATVSLVLTGGSIRQHSADTCQEGAAGSLPAAGFAGRLYFPDGGNTIFRDTGTAWTAFGPCHALKTPPLTGWVEYNVSGNTNPTTASYANGYPELVVAAGGGASGESVALIAQPVPGSTPWNCDTLILYSTPPLNGNRNAGPCFYESSTGKILSMSWVLGASVWYLSAYKWTNFTTFSDASLLSNGLGDMNIHRFFRLRNDGTNLQCYVSADGVNWVRVWTSAITSQFTPTHVGFHVNAGNSGYPIAARLIHWNLG